MIFSKYICSLMLLSSSCALFCMDVEKNNGRLCFNVDAALCVTAYNHFNMDYYTYPSNFEGKNIIQVLPLSDTQKDTIAQAFATAREKEQYVSVTYSLNDENFKAKITPLCNTSNVSYFVTVKKQN